MTIAEFLKAGEAKLKIAGIGSARLDVLIILEDGLGRDRSWLLANQNDQISAAKLKQLGKTLGLRIGHRPLAYIRGFTEFYGRRFLVNEGVLQPRPESETMIELLKQLAKSQKLIANCYIADIGTGSGALAITAKLELPNTEVIAVDVDPKCLIVARQNAKSLKADVKFLLGDLLQPLLANGYQPTAILANLPYVPRNVRLNQSAAMEPKLAIDGGSDGLDVYRRFFDQLNTLKPKPRYILTESLPPQHIKLAQIAQAASYRLQKTNDFIQLFERN